MASPLITPSAPAMDYHTPAIRSILNDKEDHDAALAAVRFLYLTLQTEPRLPRPDCSLDCGSHTPICSYTEAEHILSTTPAERIQTVLRVGMEWLKEGGRKGGPQQPEVTAIRLSPCPYLTATGACLLTTQPLECWVHRTDRATTELIGEALRGAVSRYPQRTGFVPAQLASLADQSGYELAKATGEINPSRTATGTIRPIMRGH